MSLTDRERFLAIVLTVPLTRADAIVCLCGQDGLERGKVAQQLLIQGAAPTIVLSGGLESEDKQGAKTVGDKLIGNGVSPERIIEESDSTNTREQAEYVLKLASERGWHCLLLVASPQHLPRAFLTFVQTLNDSANRRMQNEVDVRIVPVTANHVPWWGKPEGVTTTRLALLETEISKTQAYQELGDCAHYSAGLKHLKKLEGR